MQGEKYGFVYLWYDRKHKRFYIGAHWGNINDGYVSSSKWMKQAYGHRPKDFKRRILKSGFGNKRDMFAEETRILGMVKREELKVRYYNLALGNTGHWSASPDAKTIAQKSGDARRGRKMVVEADRGAKISAAKQAKRAERIAAGWSPKSRPKKGGQPGRPKLPPKFCGICNVDTGSPRRSYCKDHRYDAMNKTRASKEGSKWYSHQSH